MRENINFGTLVGEVLYRIDLNNDEIYFYTYSGRVFVMYHEQDCCEIVEVDDIVGDLTDLKGSPIVMAREDTNRDGPAKNEYDDSCTWTFYNLATNKGSVTIKWYGSSNGYYSERVSFAEVF